MQDKVLREQLLALLKGDQAHMTFADALKDFPIDHINTIFLNGTYSAYGLLEHIRRTQNDILDFMKNSKYKDKEWPKDYWPKEGTKATEKDWQKSIKEYTSDLKELHEIVKNEKTDFFLVIPHGDGQTILREIMLVADHTSYHIGEFAIMRQVMKTWKNKDH